MRLFTSPRTILAIFLAGYLTGAAHGEDLCKQLNTVPAVEKFFATQQQLQLSLPASHPLGDLSLAIRPQPNGSCRADYLQARSREDGTDVELTVECGYNGCMFGGNPRIVEWQDRVFVVALGKVPTWLADSTEWNALSKLRRAILQFRNTVDEIYELQPDGRLVLQCSYGYSGPRRKDFVPSNERALSQIKCDGFRANEVASIFPRGKPTAESWRALPGEGAQDFTYSRDKIIAADLSGDGTVDAVAPLRITSSAGCGCDRNGLVFLDGAGKRQDAPADVLPQITALNDGLECGETLDLVSKDYQYFIVKRSGALLRTIYPLTGKANTPPSCMLVNSSPLTLRPQ
jgi:hypothetical protein